MGSVQDDYCNFRANKPCVFYHDSMHCGGEGETILASEAFWDTYGCGEAMVQAGKEDKIVMLDVYTDWCTWRHKLDEEVYSDPKVAAEVNKDFVALKVNPEKGEANRKFVEQYRVEGFPTILFLNGRGEEVHRLVGYKPAGGFLGELETARAKAKAAA